MEIILYSFPKEPNSTKQPADGSGLRVQGRLREPSSIESPAIEFQNVEPVYNYAYIPIWNRYYFVEDWTAQLPLWLASMQVDVLASFKSEIGASTQYVLRSASNWDGRIVDTSYPTIAKSSVSTSTNWQALPWDLSGGSYVVGVKGDFTSFYIFTPAGLHSFFSFIFSDMYADEYFPGDWSTDFPELKVMLNPMQYISSITWYPFNLIGIGSSMSIGWGSYPGGADRVPDNGMLELSAISFTIPRHPQAATRGEYLNLSPYSRYQLFYPPWGMIPLDSTVLVNAASISTQIRVDLKTGAATLDVSTDGGTLLSRMESHLGISCEYTQVVAPGYGAGNAAVAAAGVAGSIATGNYLGAANGVLTAIGDAVSAMIPSTNSIGSVGGVGSLAGKAGLQAQFLEITAEDLDHRGRPFCQLAQISSLNGYVLCANADLSCSGTSWERQRIIQFMEGGFIYA